MRTSALALLGILACKNDGPPPAAAATKPAAAAPAPAVSLDGHRATYDFVANRVHALVHHGGRLVIPTGEVDFLKFVDGGWKSSWILGEKDAGKPAAFVSGLQSSFFVPIDGDGDGVAGRPLADLVLRVTMRSVVPKQRVSIFANEKPVASIDVEGAPRAYDVTVPASALALGENKFRLTFRSAGPIPGGKRSAAA